MKHPSLELALPGIKVTVVEGPDRGAEVVSKEDIVRVGASRSSDLVLADEAVSRHHMELELKTDGIVVSDLDSTNGTWVDGVRIIKALVRPGTAIRAGRTLLMTQAIDRPVHVGVSSKTELHGLVGESIEMRKVFALIERVAPSDATILIEGETGTGKQLVAEALHALSPRGENNFVTLDCSAVSPSLIESELFGHVRGSFTGAIGDRIGVFEEARGGTVFIDEIGELPLDLQPKLLRVLESRTVSRVGENQSRTVDVRVVAATNRDLQAEINQGRFREDLYFRLAVVRMLLPPLRKRLEDIPLLVRHLLRRLAPQLEEPPADLLQSLRGRAFPGNVRELRNLVERYLALGLSSSTIRTQPSIDALSPVGLIDESLFDLPIREAQDRWEQEFAQAYLKRLLDRSGGSVSGAARLAGTNRRYIQRLMRRYDISVE